MISITHNLDAVIAELEAVKVALATQLIPSVMQPAEYRPMLEQSARMIIAQHGAGQYADVLAAAISDYAIHNGMIFEMGPVGVAGEIPLFEPGDLGPKKLEALHGDIVEWVTREKNKTSDRDTYKGRKFKDGSGHSPGEWMSNEAIASRLEHTMRHNPDAWKNSELMLYLQEKNPTAFGRVFGLTGLHPGIVSDLLLAVLNYWEHRMGVSIIVDATRRVDQILKSDGVGS